jgi:D-arabinose 1-dehydrogenase-like Zn-dependent alcohol dehydrogenase
MMTMLAGRLDTRTLEFGVVEVPIPEPGPGQVRIKVEAAGVCLSDVHLIDGMLKPATPEGVIITPEGGTITLGHEVAGAIDALGPGVSGWQEGQRVLLDGAERHNGRMLTRGVNFDGGWAQYALAAATALFAIPDDLTIEQAAIIPDAVETSWAAITGTADARPAQAAGVWGVGGLGAHGVQLLRLVGAAPIVAVDPLPAARERALEFGADVALDPADPEVRQRVLEETGGAGLKVAFDFAGAAPVREQAIGCLAEHGKLVLVGLTDKPLTISDGTEFSVRQKKILGHFGGYPGALEELINLARRHRLDLSRSISGILPLADAAKAVEQLKSKQGNPIRLILNPWAS